MDSVSEVSEVCMRETVSVAQVVFEVKVCVYETKRGCACIVHMCGSHIHVCVHVHTVGDFA